MSKICEKCGKQFPLKIKIQDKIRNLCSRKFCLECSPFGLHNTKTEPSKESKVLLPVGSVFDGICKKHGSTKFVIRKNGNARCRACSVDAVVECRRKRKRKLVDEFGGQCIICGYKKCPQALQFHHTDPSNKEFDISKKSACLSWNKIIKEAKKCILVCANCHFEIENGIINLS